jgi:hypothetical protein
MPAALAHRRREPNLTAEDAARLDEAAALAND